MNLYHISQTAVGGYDTYSDAVVAAENEEDAKTVHPSMMEEKWDGISDDCWSSSEDVTAKLIGTASETINRGVICANFHEG